MNICTHYVSRPGLPPSLCLAYLGTPGLSLGPPFRFRKIFLFRVGFSKGFLWFFEVCAWPRNAINYEINVQTCWTTSEILFSSSEFQTSANFLQQTFNFVDFQAKLQNSIVFQPHRPQKHTFSIKMNTPGFLSYYNHK